MIPLTHPAQKITRWTERITTRGSPTWSRRRLSKIHNLPYPLAPTPYPLALTSYPLVKIGYLFLYPKPNTYNLVYRAWQCSTVVFLVLRECWLENRISLMFQASPLAWERQSNPRQRILERRALLAPLLPRLKMTSSLWISEQCVQIKCFLLQGLIYIEIV